MTRPVDESGSGGASDAAKPGVIRRPALQELYDELDRSQSASDDPVYVISVAAEMVGVHAQTLRHYERVGLVVPARSEGNIRLYSQRDVQRLATIVKLTCDLGLNLAGVEALLRMHRRLDELQRRVEGLEAELREFRGYLLEDRSRRK